MPQFFDRDVLASRLFCLLYQLPRYLEMKQEQGYMWDKVKLT
jgi:hypothetical protein